MTTEERAKKLAELDGDTFSNIAHIRAIAQRYSECKCEDPDERWSLKQAFMAGAFHMCSYLPGHVDEDLNTMSADDVINEIIFEMNEVDCTFSRFDWDDEYRQIWEAVTSDMSTPIENDSPLKP